MNVSLRFWSVTSLAAVVLQGSLAASARAVDSNVGPDPKEVQAVIDKAVAYLKQHQNDDGSFSPRLAGPGVSALVAAGLLQSGHSPSDPLVARTLAYMEKRVKKDGGIYDKFLANYTTCVALMAFQEANKNGRYDTLIKNGVKFLRRLQDGSDEANVRHGGVGYGGKQRPDMSNTAYFVDALRAAGVPKDDPAIQRALKFISRCQNVKGEFNDQPFAKKATKDDEGGFVYTPIVDPDDKRHVTPEGACARWGP
jgi:squalene-hopene/tetraprenyl-beta-curcumene cyclase